MSTILKSLKNIFCTKKPFYAQLTAIVIVALFFLAFEYKDDEVDSMNEIRKCFKHSKIETISKPKTLQAATPMPSSKLRKGDESNSLSNAGLWVDPNIAVLERLYKY